MNERVPLQIAQTVNEVWSMDFVSDSLIDGRHPGLFKPRPQSVCRQRQLFIRRFNHSNFDVQ